MYAIRIRKQLTKSNRIYSERVLRTTNDRGTDRDRNGDGEMWRGCDTKRNNDSEKKTVDPKKGKTNINI